MHGKIEFMAKMSTYFLTIQTLGGYDYLSHHDITALRSAAAHLPKYDRAFVDEAAWRRCSCDAVRDVSDDGEERNGTTKTTCECRCAVILCSQRTSERYWPQRT